MIPALIARSESQPKTLSRKVTLRYDSSHVWMPGSAADLSVTVGLADQANGNRWDLRQRIKISGKGNDPFKTNVAAVAPAAVACACAGTVICFPDGSWVCWGECYGCTIEDCAICAIIGCTLTCILLMD